MNNFLGIYGIYGMTEGNHDGTQSGRGGGVGSGGDELRSLAEMRERLLNEAWPKLACRQSHGIV